MGEVLAQIGIFGGSGFYDLLEKATEQEVETEYGRPSDKITLGEYAGKKIAFLPRHGRDHRWPSHRVPYKANLAAFKKLGVARIIAPCAAGSLQGAVKPGDFVVLDQYVDRTRGRDDTFFPGPKVVHLPQAEPYCPEFRSLAIKTCRELKIPVHEKGTVVVIQGPRFSTRAESQWFSSLGWEVINMTQYPEVYLAREMEICYTGIALITDYDVGLEGQPEVKPVTIGEVLKIFKANNEKVKKLIFKMIEEMPPERSCGCGHALKEATL